jgi:hypothetical protein
MVLAMTPSQSKPSATIKMTMAAYAAPNLIMCRLLRAYTLVDVLAVVAIGHP